MIKGPLKSGIVSRRSFLTGGASSCAIASHSIGALRAAENNKSESDLPLKQIAAARGILFGAAAVATVLQTDSAMASLYRQETAIITADYEMKWAVIRPVLGSYSYDKADYLASFAKKNNLQLRGHCLAWQESNPSWVNATVTKDNAEKVLLDHVQQVAGRYAGQIHSWDVVNEPIWPDHGRPGGLRDGVWLRTLGPKYIDIAFHATRAADPNAMLVLNEAGTEVATARSKQRRRHFLNLLDRLKRDNVPVDAVGLECHFSTRSPFDREDFMQYLSALSRRGYKILITELDVHDLDETISDVRIRDEAVAKMYEAVVSAAVRNPAVVSIVTWELSDKYTWLRDPQHLGKSARPDGSPARPLPFDDQMRRKPAWQAIARALAL